jgi:wyosine [tRNA(Phe)-imidazoG37] synthetase (radical SAM superfamily)
MFRTLELLYPVISRRSGGLSLGIDLFPDGKRCNFNCPYCELFPFPGEPPFEPAELDRELGEFFHIEYASYLPGTPLRDLCLSGSGEPTLSPHLGEALASMRRAQARFAPEAALVLITNSTNLGDEATAALLGRFVDEAGLRIWAKLDGGSEAMYSRMNRSSVPFEKIVSGIRSFSRKHPVVVQTMLCEVDGAGPSARDLSDYGDLLASFLKDGAQVREVHLYTQARPSPEGRTAALPDDFLLKAAAGIADRLGDLPVRVFGPAGELPR